MGLYLAALYLREGGPLGPRRCSSAATTGQNIWRPSSLHGSRRGIGCSWPGPRCWSGCAGRCARRCSTSGAPPRRWRAWPVRTCCWCRWTRGGWYRYHHLFRDMLLADLGRLEPGLIPVLRRRRRLVPAERAGRGGAGVLHGGRGRRGRRPAGGDARLPGLPPGPGPPCSGGSGGWRTGAGSRDTRWSPCWPRSSPRGGAAGEAERWADVVDRWRITGMGPGPVTRAPSAGLPCFGLLSVGAAVMQMRADADEAARRFAASGSCAGGRDLPGIALLLSATRKALTRPSSWPSAAGGGIGAPDVLRTPLCERSLLAMARGEWSPAEALVSQAPRPAPGRDRGSRSVCAVQARVAVAPG